MTNHECRMTNEAPMTNAARQLQHVAVLLHPRDNVAVLKKAVRAGDELVHDSVLLVISQNVAAGHKIALVEIADSAPIHKYGQIIGFAKGAIAPGEHVHLHNVAM